MSSSWRRRRRPWAAAAVALGLTVCAAAPALAASAAVSPALTVQSTGSAADPRMRVVADSGVRDPESVGGPDLSLSASGTPLRSETVPLLSSRTDLVVILDTTRAAQAGLDGVRSGVTDLLLELPAGARSGVVAAGALPRVLAPLAPGATGALAQLSGLDASGEASGGGSSSGSSGASGSGSSVAGSATPGSPVASALGLAVSDLGSPSPDARPRVVVLHTSSRDAGGESARALAGRLRAASVVLEVVGGSAEAAYWTPVAESTGGHLVATGPSGAARAVARLSDALRHTFLVTVRRPTGAATQLALRVGGAGRGAGATVALAAGRSVARTATTAPAKDGGHRQAVALAAVVVALLAAAAALIVRWDRRRPRGKHEPGAPVQDLLTLFANQPEPAASIAAPQSMAVPPLHPPVPAPASAPPMAPAPSPPTAPAPAAPALWPWPEPAPEPDAEPAVTVLDRQPEPTPEPAPTAQPAPSAEPAPAQRAAAGEGEDGAPPRVTDAERRARAAGAAVAAAARVARARSVHTAGRAAPAAPQGTGTRRHPDDENLSRHDTEDRGR